MTVEFSDIKETPISPLLRFKKHHRKDNVKIVKLKGISRSSITWCLLDRTWLIYLRICRSFVYLNKIIRHGSRKRTNWEGKKALQEREGDE